MPTRTNNEAARTAAVFFFLFIFFLAARAAGQVKPDSVRARVYIMPDVPVNANREISLHALDTLKPVDLQHMPTLFSIVLSSIKILPGVSSNTELSSTYNVRGGNFDENLIYINGFEISQPYLVQQGIEQSQSIINEDMVSSLEFHHGAFPVHLGDKMSSALSVKYYTGEEDEFGGTAHADLFNAGLTLHDKTGTFSWRAGVRYAYPILFERSLQSSGLYHPSFGDIQVLGSYHMPDNAELQLLLITARNTFAVTPQRTFGRLTTTYADRTLSELEYTGNSNYTNATTLAGVKFIRPFGGTSILTTSLAYSHINEEYEKYYSYNNPYALQGQSKKQYDVTDNSLVSRKLELISDYTVTSRAHTIKAGMNLRLSKLESALDRATLYGDPDLRLHALNAANQTLNARFNTVAAYIEDNVSLHTNVSVDAGVRALKYYFNGELLVSPRAGVTYRAGTRHAFSLTWGHYYQPPYFYETWDKSLQTAQSLLAPKSVQYNARWEYHPKERATYTAEVFYKHLTRLIPYSVDQLRLSYQSGNHFEGYAAGMDLQYEGELVRGVRTWFGYSYLNCQEKDTRSMSSYQPRPLDQTHTLRIYLQDRGRTNPNFQAHVLLLLGSGYHYYRMMSVPGSAPGTYEIVPDFTRTREYPFYERVDMGLSYRFPFGEGKGITLIAEVLNVFDKYNVSSYSWYIFESGSRPELVPNILSPRYFNAGFRFDF